MTSKKSSLTSPNLERYKPFTTTYHSVNEFIDTTPQLSPLQIQQTKGKLEKKEFFFKLFVYVSASITIFATSVDSNSVEQAPSATSPSMPKEKNYNPVQAQRKADKAREVRKGKAEAQGRRNEKLARKNPDRIQKQIDDLKAVTAGGGKLTRHEEQVLEGLEKELSSVRKARDTLGDKAPSFGRGWRRDDDGSRSGALGKRRRGDDDGSSDDDDIPDDVRSIPMPRDTPPPIPKAEMDKWYAKRRAKRNAENAARRRDAGDNEAQDGEDNDRGKGRDRGQRNGAPVVESRTVYEAKPVVRDLRKEAVAAFVPTSVQMKMSKGKGQGGLMEPEEADRLEKEGYLKVASGADRDEAEAEAETAPSRHVVMEEVEDEDA